MKYGHKFEKRLRVILLAGLMICASQQIANIYSKTEEEII